MAYFGRRLQTIFLLLIIFVVVWLPCVSTSVISSEGTCSSDGMEQDCDYKGVNDSYSSETPEDDTDTDDDDERTLTITHKDGNNKETVTIELGDDLLHRIHLALQESGVLSDDKERIQQIAMEEVHKWHAEEQDNEKLRWQHQQSKQQQQLLEQTDFPYTLQPPPPPVKGEYSLKFVQQEWSPPGGHRYAEYATGQSPYFLTSELKKQSDDIARLRRPYIKRAMEHAWKGYVDHAFGADEVRPQSKQGTNHWGGISVTLVDSLDTLLLMNMTQEFRHARDYVQHELSHDQNRKVSVFETTIRSLGGLLSAYDWSRDAVFLEEAMDLARRLMRAFEHPVAGETILPFGEVNLQSGSCNMIPWAGGNAILSEFGTLQIEFRYLDEIMRTRETRRFRDKVETIFELLHEMSPDNGLFPYYMKTDHTTDQTAPKELGRSSSNRLKKKKKANNDPQNKPFFTNDHLTFGAMADSFYEYMLKIWLQGGKTEPMYRDMYDKAMQGMHDELLHVSTPSGLTYLADQVGGGNNKRKRIHHKMDHLCCFVGGMLALGAYTDPLGLESPRAQRDLETAKALTYTCYQMYARMNTGISPEYVEFSAGEDFKIGKGAPHYLLRPETVESMYILNVLTGDPIYREWGWEIFQSIEKYCRTHVAYGSLKNVQEETSNPRDDMESFFLAETLKYLYLLNDPDSKIDILNKHVFNTEAHPMRIFPVIEQDLKEDARQK
ncbi:oligosaccharide 1,2-alpha-mannosidase [Seminavis robusta]|uniref:alpha-1,2-Mannosidase n=1 Tax=Seminavis robusta TaxID=568900 RepID=A0A9N8DAN1_9STRA|nr:oligosaccharide 1,2-alpha-mannosidase [Seminavis robusta]|eukprot:Sro67_g037440.1 oligosaccharide 1,2-alpha-mannosidase (721) ;mRNA; r:14626-17010